MTKWQK